MPAERQVLCVSLHDVAPATLDDCIATLEFLDDLHVGPVSLLVVPDYHGLGRVDRQDSFCSFLRGRERRGDELVLHGYSHHDDAGPCREPLDWFQRRVLTDREGEFARLDASAARTRILRGLAVLRSAGWRPRGFVAPAWLMSPGTREALDSLPLGYCATRDHILRLPAGEPIRAPSLVMSTRGRWRRALCPLWNRTRLDRYHDSPVLRAALHPQDVRYPSIAATWRELLLRLSDRSVRTEGQLVPG